MSSPEYEFDAQQNSLIQGLADKMRFVAYVMIAAGVLTAIAGLVKLPGGVSDVVSGIVYCVIGVWTNNAASAFRRIVDTEGSDMQHLTGALVELKKLYALQYWALMVVLVVMVAAVVLGVVFGVAAAVK